jgi:excisionase family DNA binding protein
MSRARRQINCPRDPIGLSAEEAAAYLGVSATTFLAAVEKRLLPGPRELLGRVIWDADELRGAFRRLPQRGKSGQDGSDGGINWDDVAA